MVPPKLLLQCYITIILTSYIHSFSIQSSSTRRDVLEQIKNLSISPFVATSLISNVNNIANAVESTTTPIEASWKAVDGLNSSDGEGKFVSFDKSGEHIETTNLMCTHMSLLLMYICYFLFLL